MDLLPIQPISNNLIKPTTGTANDGGSKSQGGYVNVRTGKNEKTDKITISEESKRLIGEDPVIDEKSLFTIIKEFILSVFRNIVKIFNFKLPEKAKQEPQEIEKIEISEKGEVKDFLGFTRHTSE